MRHEVTIVRQEEGGEDLIGAALRRVYRIQPRTDETFDELIRRLARKEQPAPQER